jgi:hypothetical protein
MAYSEAQKKATAKYMKNKLDDIKEIINKAIANSEKRASRKFFGGLKKKRSDNGDVIFLTEADFKD